MTDLGLYIHVPFCACKCNYCDFYSFTPQDGMTDSYTKRVTEEITKWGVRLACPIDTLYLGGGTPSLLGGKNIAAILTAAESAFGFLSPEITLEANPADDLFETLKTSAQYGVNRLSLGVQSGLKDELSLLGRRHTNADVVRTVKDARRVGIDNISLDLMIGLPNSTCDTVRQSLSFVLSLDPCHISVYILKKEENTPFYKKGILLPDEDEVARQYLLVCKELEKSGFLQYEISNFSKKGFESRHNLRYWTQKNYLGIGPAAHSFIEGKRFYFPRDCKAFLNGAPVCPDGTGGERDEYIMLRLRLREGIILEDYERRFGAFPPKLIATAEKFSAAGLMELREGGFALTPKGFLVSNALIGEFL